MDPEEVESIKNNSGGNEIRENTGSSNTKRQGRTENHNIVL